MATSIPTLLASCGIAHGAILEWRVLARCGLGWPSQLFWLNSWIGVRRPKTLSPPTRLQGAPVCHNPVQLGCEQLPSQREHSNGSSRSHDVSTEPPSAVGRSPLAHSGGEGIGAASSPAEWRERGAGRPNPGFGRPLLVADRGERGIRAAASQVGAVGSLPLSRCATAPPAPRGSDWIEVVRRWLRRRGWQPPPQSLRDSCLCGGSDWIGYLPPQDASLAERRPDQRRALVSTPRRPS